MLEHHKQNIRNLLLYALDPLIRDSGINPVIGLERPRDPSHGDIASNIALQLAKALKKNPRDLAQEIVSNLLALPDHENTISSAETAGPGFINLRLTPAARQEVVHIVLGQKENYGRSNLGENKKVMIEFVSANPTGPLHVGHGRQGALGDALAALFESQGYRVTREFYYNDAGVQIDNLTRSVQARARNIHPGDADWPSDAYGGDYISDIAQDFLAKKTVSALHCDAVTATGDTDDLESIRNFAVTYLRNEQDNDLNVFGIHFDSYYLESSLYTDGKVDATVEALNKSGKTYEKDGALWLRTTDYGDDLDRVMRMSRGGYTYFVPDVAYHINKWQRGYETVINIQGSDHQSTVLRVRSGLHATGMGIPDNYPGYILHKMVKVTRKGAEVKISKRAGDYVTMRDLVEWSGDGDIVRGRDAVRFFLISRKAETEFTFDVDLALARTDENPVYYVQYAHARICSVFEQWGKDVAQLENADLSLLVSPYENTLLGQLANYPDVLRHALNEREPHQIAFYLRDLAGALHGYYNAERFLVEEEALRNARLALLMATRQVLRNGLTLLGVSYPSKM